MGAYIILSSIFMQQVWGAWRAIFGTRLLILFFVVLYLLALAAIIHKSIKARIGLKRLILVGLVYAAGFILALRQPYLSEKAHVLEFGLLGWLAVRDLNRHSGYSAKNLLAALVFIAIIGVLEEGLQKLLPWRVCEIRDMLTDVISGGLGIILFILS